MIKKLSSKMTLLIGAAVVISAALTTAVVMAAIPDADGKITACLKDTNGTTRIIDTATENCSANESSIAWSQNGGVKAYGYVEHVDEGQGSLPTLRAGYFEHAVSVQNSALTLDIACLDLDATVLNPKQVQITGVGTIDPPTGNLAVLDGNAATYCPGAEVIVYKGSPSHNFFFRVY